jgi:hypothetical protein
MWRFGPLPLAGITAQSVLLGSNSILLQQGSFTRSHTVALSGNEAGTLQGTLKPDRNKPLTTTDSEGVQTQVLTARGTLTYVLISGGDIEVFPVGEESAGEQGTAIANRTVPLTGSASTSGIGTLIPVIAPTTLISQLIQPAAGTLVYTLPGAADVTVNLNAGEMEVNSFIGSVLPKTALSGQASTTGQGSVAPGERTEALTGSGSTTGQGSVAVQQDVEDTYITSSQGTAIFEMLTALSGTQVVLNQGTVTASADVTLALTGEDADVEIGSMVDSFEFQLTGIEMLGEQTDDNFGLPLNIELTGAESLAEAGTVYLDDDRSYPLTGTQVLVEAGTAPVFVNAFVNGETVLTEQYLFEVLVALDGSEMAGEQGRIKLKSNQGGGHPHGPGKDKDKDKKKKKKVTVDGQMFEVDDEELKELLKVAQEIAAVKAKEEADAMVAAKSTEKIRLKVPKVTGSEELKDAIADIYMQATIDAEVSRNRQLDEEEALVLLLLN